MNRKRCHRAEEQRKPASKINQEKKKMERELEDKMKEDERLFWEECGNEE